MSPNTSSRLDDLAGSPARRFTRHRHAMLMLDRLEELSPEHAVCTWRVPGGHPVFGVPGGIPVYLAIECMAQCVAVQAGAIAYLDGCEPPLGLLLGTRKFEASEELLKEGVTYQITCQELVRDGQGLASFDCSISHDGSPVAACRLAVYEYRKGGPRSDADE